MPSFQDTPDTEGSSVTQVTVADLSWMLVIKGPLVITGALVSGEGSVSPLTGREVVGPLPAASLAVFRAMQAARVLPTSVTFALLRPVLERAPDMRAELEELRALRASLAALALLRDAPPHYLYQGDYHIALWTTDDLYNYTKVTPDFILNV